MNKLNKTWGLKAFWRSHYSPFLSPNTKPQTPSSIALCDSAKLIQACLPTVWGDINSPQPTCQKLANPWMKSRSSLGRSSQSPLHAAVWNFWGYDRPLPLNIYLLHAQPVHIEHSVIALIPYPSQHLKYSSEERAENLGSLVLWQTAQVCLPAPQSKQLVTLYSPWWTLVRCIGWLFYIRAFLPHWSSCGESHKLSLLDNCVFLWLGHLFYAHNVKAISTSWACQILQMGSKPRQVSAFVRSEGETLILCDWAPALYWPTAQGS